MKKVLPELLSSSEHLKLLLKSGKLVRKMDIDICAIVGSDYGTCSEVHAELATHTSL